MKEQKEVKVTKMVIQLTDEQISLSMPEAKKLYEALAELFGKKTVEHHYSHDYWYYRPYRWLDNSYAMAASQSIGSSLKQSTVSNNLDSFKSLSALSEYKTDNGTAFSMKGSALMCNIDTKK